MKWYFATRMKHREIIDKLEDILKQNDHEIVYEWTKQESIKPYSKNPKKCSAIAKNIADSLKEVDIFVLIADKGGTDMFIELGITIGYWIKNKNLKIYAVGKYKDRSLMHHHPAINRVDTLKEVFQKESPNLLNKELTSFLNSVSF